MASWKILVVDDEEGIHGITRMIFRGYEFEQQPIELISAMNSAQAKELLKQHSDIALVLLDVVMETDNEGLKLVDYIRNQLNNNDIRIILRTGHPGYAPEAEVIVSYDINDYLSKAELSASRLLTAVVVALRSFRDIKNARSHTQYSLETKAPSPTTTSGEHPIAPALTEQVKQLISLSQRLTSFDLNPVVKDLLAELHTQHLRLNEKAKLLSQLSPSHSFEEIRLSSLFDQALMIFLSQSRRQGLMLDYSIHPDLQRKRYRCDIDIFMSLLTLMIELAIDQMPECDLKLSLFPTVHDNQLRLSISPTSSVSTQSTETDLHKQIVQRIQQICSVMHGQLDTNQENEIISCILEIDVVY